MKIKSSHRRDFLKRTVALPFMRFSPALAPSLVGASNCVTGDNRSLVCVFLEGGADTFNFAVPGGQKYQDYLSVRGDLAVSNSASGAPGSPFLPASDSVVGPFGFNGLLGGFRSLYNQNKLAVVCNLGNLAKPTTSQQYLSGTHQLPDQLFAHDSQQKLWQTAGSSLAQSFGWGGLTLENKNTCNSGANIGAATAVSHANTWLNNASIPYTSLRPLEGMPPLAGYDSSVYGASSAVHAILDNLKTTAANGNRSIFEQSVANSIDNTITATQVLNDIIVGNTYSVNMSYAGHNSLAKQLETVARMINAREALNMGRQVFFVSVGGWDTHRNQNDVLSNLLPQLNEAISEFQGAIDAMGKANSVTTFTASEFGRTLTPSLDGSDHGWGGHAFVIGGAVDGGKIFGNFPEFKANNNPDDAPDGNGNFAGRIIPQIATSQYAATLGDWMGLTAAERNNIFPDLANGGFSTSNLGFML